MDGFPDHYLDWRAPALLEKTGSTHKQNMKKTLSLTLAALALAASPAIAAVLFDSQGFELPGYTLGNLAGQNTWAQQGTATATIQNVVVQSGSQAVAIGGTGGTWFWPSSSYTPAPGEVIQINCGIRRGSSENPIKHVGHLLDIYNAAGDARIGRVGLVDDGGPVAAIATSVTPDGSLVNYYIAEGLEWDTWYDFKVTLDFAAQTYDVEINGELVATGFPFVEPTTGFGDADIQLISTDGATDVGYFDNYIVEIIREPAVRIPPQNRTVAVGDDANFSVVASGALPLGYQWWRGSSPIPGATQAAYNLANCQFTDTGAAFLCVVTNTYGAVTSTPATLTVVAGVRLCEAVDACTLTWASGGAAGWLGQTTNTYDGVDAAASGAIGDNQESWVETTIVGPGVVTFQWSASCDLGYDFLQFRTNGVLAEQITGVVPWTEFSLRLPAGPQTLRWEYIKDNEFGSGDDQGLLDQVVFVADGPEPLITGQPQDQTVIVGDAATFTVTVSGEAPLSYQWFRNSAPISGATMSSYTLVNCQFADAGSAFYCVVTNIHDSATSATAYLWVNSGIALCDAMDACSLAWTTGGNLPWFGQADTTHDGVDAGQNGDVNDSQESWVETVAEGPGTLTFWWNVSSESGWDFFEFHTNGILVTRISGTNGTWAQLTQRVGSGPQTLRWRYIKDSTVSTGQDSAWLDQVVFVADDPAPVLVIHPQNQTVGIGGSATFSAAAEGRFPLSFSWRRDGNPIPGATESNYTLTNCGLSDSGSQFQCVVTNGFGAATSSVASLTVELKQNLTYDATGAITIPSSGTATPYPSIINVAESGTLTKVSVTLKQISHTFPDDMDVLLVGPQGQNVMLMSDVGGGTDISNVTLTLDSTAPSSLPDSTVLTSGIYRPTNIGATDTMPAPAPAAPYGTSLDAFAGTNPQGEWRLFVVDAFTGDSGSIAGGWTLNLTLSIPVPVLLDPYVAEGDMHMSFDTLSGLEYVVQWSETMAPGTWHTLEAVAGDGTRQTVTDPLAANLNRFYRILLQ
jgi:subtilisin-like proprotein convertase family protein